MGAIYHRFDDIMRKQPRFKANIPSINLQARKPNWFFPSELKKWRSRLSENEKDLFLPRTEGTKCKNTKNILLDGCYLLFEYYLQGKKNICLYPETVLRNKPKFWSLRRGKVVKNSEIFWMNDETIIKLSFRLMWIMQISEAVLHLGG